MTGAFRVVVALLLVLALVALSVALYEVSRQVRAGRKLRGAEVGALAFAVALWASGAIYMLREIVL